MNSIKNIVASIVIVLVIINCSTVPHITVMPPNIEDKNEYFQFVEWQREVQSLESSIKTMDYIGGAIFFGGLIAAITFEEYSNGIALVAGLTTGAIEYTAIPSMEKDLIELISIGKNKGWILSGVDHKK